MSLKITITHPSQAPDAEFEVPGAGLVKNGSSVTLDEDQEAHFFAITGMKVRDYYKDNEMVKVEGSSDARLPTTTDAPKEGGK